MEEIFLNILKDHGIAGLVVAYFLYKEIHVKWKKKTGKYVGYDNLSNNIRKLEIKLEQHLEGATQRIVDLELLKNSYSHKSQYIIERMDNIEVEFKSTKIEINKLFENVSKDINEIKGYLIKNN